MSHQSLSPEHEKQIEELVQTFCPELRLAPEESWLPDEEGAFNQKGRAVGFRNVCECDDHPLGPELVVFLKGETAACGTNLVGKLEHALARWLLADPELLNSMSGCGICKVQLGVDVRLFVPRPKKISPEASEDLESVLDELVRAEVEESLYDRWVS